MRIFGRMALSVLVLLGATGALVNCSDDDETSGGEDPPRTEHDILAVTAAGAAAVRVLDNDRELDNPPLSYSIEDSPTVGSASFNADGTVRLDLPAGFRGVTRFRYRVTNSLGGFSISTAVVFVDVPAYRVLFAAKNSAQALELYATDLISSWQVSRAASGNFRLQNAWPSETGRLVVYERADPAQPSATAELYHVRVTANANPERIPKPAGRTFIPGTPVRISQDDRWIAFPTTPATGSTQEINLYVRDTSAGQTTLVRPSTNVMTDLVQWSANRLYYIASPTGNTSAVYRASTSALDAAERVSPIYSAQDTHDQLLVSPDETKILVTGTHGNQYGVFLIDPAAATERRLTTDILAGGVIESYYVDENFTQLTYLWRTPGAATARLSVVSIASNATPRTVLNSNITAFTEVRPDGNAALVTRGASGPLQDGTLYEVMLDGSGTETRIANNVGGGLYDDTGDNVFLFSSSQAPAVVNRASFNRNTDPLVRSTTPSSVPFVTPESARSAAIIEDPVRGLVLVNATAPGRTLRLTDREMGPVPPTLLPTAIDP
jgi:hypothetical protein